MNAIITERLIIRKPKDTDLQDFLAYRNNKENLRFQPVQQMDESDALVFLKEQMLVSTENGSGWIMFAIELRDEKRMIGEVGIYIPCDIDNTGDLGWSVHQDHQGKGYAAEAAQVLLKYAFELRKLRRVTGTCVSANTASVRLMKRICMHEVLGSTKHQLINGMYYEEQVYAISYEEWAALGRLPAG